MIAQLFLTALALICPPLPVTIEEGISERCLPPWGAIRMLLHLEQMIG